MRCVIAERTTAAVSESRLNAVDRAVVVTAVRAAAAAAFAALRRRRRRRRPNTTGAEPTGTGSRSYITSPATYGCGEDSIVFRCDTKTIIPAKRTKYPSTRDGPDRVRSSCSKTRMISKRTPRRSFETYRK